MSRFRKRGVRCDWCGKIASNESGEYQRPVKNAIGYHLAGYMHQPDWERFSDNQALRDSGHDICEECAEKFDPETGEPIATPEPPMKPMQ